MVLTLRRHGSFKFHEKFMNCRTALGVAVGYVHGLYKIEFYIPQAQHFIRGSNLTFASTLRIHLLAVALAREKSLSGKAHNFIIHVNIKPRAHLILKLYSHIGIKLYMKQAWLAPVDLLIVNGVRTDYIRWTVKSRFIGPLNLLCLNSDSSKF